MDSALWRLTATHLAELIRQCEVSPVDAVRAVLERIEQVNPSLNAYVTVVPERALERAQSAAAAVARGDRLGPLHGVPISVKDSVWVRGVRATCGSVIYRDFTPDRDAVAVERLEAAGAIVLGKTNLPDLSQKGFTSNRLFGVTRNPWDLGRTPGGSTGGGAAAVAAGMGPLTLGTDAGGSIRRPASHTGLVGFKPSQGRIPHGPGFPDTSPGYAVLGPLARTVADAALMFGVMTGSHPRDRESLLAAPSDLMLLGGPFDREIRIAWSVDFGDRAVAPAVRVICQRAVQAFEELGYHVERADPPIPADFEQEVTRALGAPATAEVLDPHLPALADQIDPSLLQAAATGREVTGREVYRAKRRQADLYEALRSFFERYDFLLTPTVAALPWPLESEYPARIDGRPAGPRGHAVFTPFVNHTGLPAASVPAGWTDPGLPVGLQIVGPYLADGAVLRLAAHFEQARPWAHRWPPEQSEAGSGRRPDPAAASSEGATSSSV